MFFYYELQNCASTSKKDKSNKTFGRQYLSDATYYFDKFDIDAFRTPDKPAAQQNNMYR